MNRIAIIGGGKIGSALLAGLFKAGYQAKDLILCDRNTTNSAEIVKKYSLRVTTSISDTLPGANVVILAVKPADVESALAEIKTAWEDTAEGATLVTLAPGIKLSSYEAALPAGSPVVIAMPNVAMAVQESLTAIAGGRFVEENHLQQIGEIFSVVGKVVYVSEDKIAAVAAVSGSGPAYAFILAEAMIDTAIALGLSKEEAIQMTNQTILGAGKMLVNLKTSAVDLRYKVTSPGGSTAAAISQLERNNFRGAINKALYAAVAKSNSNAEEES